MNDKPTGIASGLTNYGDRDFSAYLRRSFAQSMGYSRAMLARPVVGIAYTASGFNNCHARGREARRADRWRAAD
jgi:dihydroxy-acid dehydratase